MNSQSCSFRKTKLNFCSAIFAQKSEGIKRIRDKFQDLYLSGLGEFIHSSDQFSHEQGVNLLIQTIPENLCESDESSTYPAVKPVNVKID